MGLGIKGALPFEGCDRWTCYEVSWLNREGVPQVGIASIEYPADSPMLVESKSVKLFLGSMNFTRFDDSRDVSRAIREALVPVLQTSAVSVVVREPNTWSEVQVASVCGESIDGEKPLKEGSPRLRSGEEEVEEVLFSNLLRSLCPVTSQPDWGTVVISYTGKQLDRSSLMTYLIAHRSFQGFHEECCERIFGDVLGVCMPSQLWIGCFYTRRGGVDINPERWLPGSKRPHMGMRLARQ
jgi:7-cyano-7-deazaguanine reductase